MKKIYILVSTVLLSLSALAQAPEKLSYQAVIRNSNNTLVVSSPIGVRISILQGSINGTAVYSETQSPSTNANGLVTLQIGSGTVVSGSLGTIDWSNGPFFVKTETDPTGAINYTISGTSELLSVPYAFYAKNTDPTITNSISADLAQEVLNRSNADALKANIASPAFTGSPTAPTAPEGTNTTQIATTEFVSNATSTLNNTINTEKTRAEGAEATLTSNLAQEVVNRTNADASKANLTLNNISDLGAARSNLGLGNLATSNNITTSEITNETIKNEDISSNTLTSAKFSVRTIIVNDSLSVNDFIVIAVNLDTLTLPSAPIDGQLYIIASNNPSTIIKANTNIFYGINNFSTAVSCYSLSSKIVTIFYSETLNSWFATVGNAPQAPLEGVGGNGGAGGDGGTGGF